MTTEEDANWICTADIQSDLIQLHGSNRKKWRKDMTKMISEHPSKFSILTVGLVDDGDNLYTFDEFKAHFTGTIDNDKLLQLMYDDIEHHDKTHIKYLAIHRWINEVKKQKDIEIVKDDKWLFTKILHVQAAHLDADGSGDIDREEFVNYFAKKIGFPQYIAHAMFDDIDVNKDGDLSIMEYTKWKNRHNKPHKLQKFLAKVEAKKKEKKKKANANTENIMKCEQCRALRQEISELNNKQTNLLRDYKQLSQLLQNGKNGQSGVNVNDAITQQRIKSLQRENKRLADNISDLEDENKSAKTHIRDMKQKLSKNEMNLQLKEEDIERLNALLNDISSSTANDGNRDKIEIYLKENEELNNKLDAQNTKMKELKNEMNRIQIENDDENIEINTKKEEIVLLQARLNLYTKESSNAYDEQMKQVRKEKNELVTLIEKQRKEMKRLRGELEETHTNMEGIQKDKRQIKSELSEKEGEIEILSHKLELKQQELEDHNASLEAVVDSEEYQKVKAHNDEIEEQNMKHEVNIKHLKQQIHDLETDLQKEKENIQFMRIDLDKEKTVAKNAQKVQQNQLYKIEAQKKEIDALKSEKSSIKQDVFELNALLEKHHIEKETIKREKEELHNKIVKEKHNQVVLIQQFDELESAKMKDVRKVEFELASLKGKYKSMVNALGTTERMTKETLVNTQEQNTSLKKENKHLKRKLKTEKNYLDAILREVVEMEEKQRAIEEGKVHKAAIQQKHNLSKLEIQIEIINSDVFRMRSLLLLSKYEKLNMDQVKYYSFLEFVEKDLSNKVLINVFGRLKIKESISAIKLAPLLTVIVKLYMLRLSKLKTGEINKKQDVDRRIVEHFGVWIIRNNSNRTDAVKEVAVLDDANKCIKGTYSVFDGIISKTELITLFASWCREYTECNGRHDDSKLT